MLLPPCTHQRHAHTAEHAANRHTHAGAHACAHTHPHTHANTHTAGELACACPSGLGGGSGSSLGIISLQAFRLQARRHGFSTTSELEPSCARSEPPLPAFLPSTPQILLSLHPIPLIFPLPPLPLFSPSTPPLAAPGARHRSCQAAPPAVGARPWREGAGRVVGRGGTRPGERGSAAARGRTSRL